MKGVIWMSQMGNCDNFFFHLILKKKKIQIRRRKWLTVLLRIFLQKIYMLRHSNPYVLTQVHVTYKHINTQEWRRKWIFNMLTKFTCELFISSYESRQKNSFWKIFAFLIQIIWVKCVFDILISFFKFTYAKIV